MKALVTKRKARRRRRCCRRSAPQQQPTLTRHGDLYKAGVRSPDELVKREVVHRLRAALGVRPLVDQIARVIVEVYASDMAVTERVLKLRYILTLFSLSTDILPEALRVLVTPMSSGDLVRRMS